MVDKVKPLKIESTAGGGTQNDMFPVETSPSADYLAAKGVAFENSDSRLIDLDGSGNLQFTDAGQGSPFRLNKLVKDFGTTTHSLLAETQATAAGTKTLSLSSYTKQIFTGTATGQIVKLPDATTLQIGHYFEFINKSNQNITVQYNDGSTAFVLGLTSVAFITLDSASTVNGSWTFWQTFISGTATGILNYVVTSNTPFNTNSVADVLITGFTVTPVAGRYAVWYSADASVNKNNTQIQAVQYYGGAVNENTRRTLQSPTSSFRGLMANLGEANVNGSQSVDVRVNTSDAGSTYTTGQRSMFLIRLGT